VPTSLWPLNPERRHLELIAEPSHGRRKGDTILVALTYAVQRGDFAVAQQLSREYQKITGELPPGITVDRRVPRPRMDFDELPSDRSRIFSGDENEAAISAGIATPRSSGDRRRPGRSEQISPVLLPLLRQPTVVHPSRRHPTLRSPAGMVVVFLLSLTCWALLIAAIIFAIR
jgi:hypothetical protein